MRAALVALPWCALERPSGALGALAAFVRREAPDFDVEARYAYVEVATRLGSSLYSDISGSAYEIGELLYLCQLFPEHATEGWARCVAWLGPRITGRVPMRTVPLDAQVAAMASGDYGMVASFVRSTLGEAIDDLVAEMRGHYRVVGLTTTFGQLFANLLFAARLRAVDPDVAIVLGGSTVSGRVGPSILEHFSQVDYIVQGEGEIPFVRLLRHIAEGTSADAERGILTRGNVRERRQGTVFAETPRLDDLPVPDYDSYADAMAALGQAWILPIEGSRGCWWDRSRQSGNPKKTCHFCNLNVQWGGYREKTPQRISSEVKDLMTRYGSSNFFFLDNIVRLKGVEDLARELEALGADLTYFYEMRANLSPYEILRLWQSGLTAAQFGIEGLSTSYLRRIGKGTATIQNLQVMKVCYELRIFNAANLLLAFPGSTSAEVAETLATIERYAVMYQPLTPARFWLGTNSTVDVLQREYPIRNVRNRDFYRTGLPHELYRSLDLFDLSFDEVGEVADWSPVEKACARWRDLHASPVGALASGPASYLAGDDFVRVHTHTGDTQLLRGTLAEMFLFCCQIRTTEELEARFGRSDDAVDELVGLGVVYREGPRHLTVIPATRPQFAARRIETARARDLASAPRLASASELLAK